MRIIELEEVDSTNEYCKRYAEKENLIVTAVRQTGGRGTKGRSFASDEGGLYVSVMRYYDNLDASSAFKIMVNSCVAVCRTLESFNLKPVIKWANDVLVGGKKICGTLIENKLSGSKISRSIVGIGINVNNDLPADLKDIATSIKEQTGKIMDLKTVKRTLFKYLKYNYSIEEYKSYINWFNSEVILKLSDREESAVAIDVDNEGNLICKVCGSLKRISSAEVSLRL